MFKSADAELEDSTLGLHTFDDYTPLIGPQAVARITRKAEALRDRHVIHVSSTFYGGGVSEILTPLTLLMNQLGIETGWRLIQGTPDFFRCTKKIHNALQGAVIEFTPEDKAVYEQVISENALRLHLDGCDTVIVHDPQPLPLILHVENSGARWIWQCHVDLSSPNPDTWAYLREFIGHYDATMFSLADYEQPLDKPQLFMTPAINPFSAKNRELSEEEIDRCLAEHRIPTHRPIVVQVSRFDRWKDPVGVIEAFRLACKQVDSTLVLLGNDATDDPEGQIVLETILRSADERVMVISVDDPILVNALQRRAAVVLQKSIREGFGLTVTEAMWKGAAVVGGNVGGIRRQIDDGENGFLVDTVAQAAERIVELVRRPDLRRRLGENARETVRLNFLMSRLLEDWLDVIADGRPHAERDGLPPSAGNLAGIGGAA
jgi:trehalose synthase